MVEIEPTRGVNSADHFEYAVTEGQPTNVPSQKLKDIETLLGIADLDLDPQTKKARTGMTK